ncbi:hypothetical protein [Ectopseudomonas khazarica]|uniref:hypothetical protein n=1 Tax=Ectopseudomonas khazarica TaxID=2502979 RepID=UPI003A94C731
MSKAKTAPAGAEPEQSQVVLQPDGEAETVAQDAEPAEQAESQQEQQEQQEQGSPNDAAKDEAEPEYIEVRVLRDEPAYGLRCGQVVMLDVVTAELLDASGGIDADPAAVEAARGDAPAATTDVIEADD